MKMPPAVAAIEIDRDGNVSLHGAWTLAGLRGAGDVVARALAAQRGKPESGWDLSNVDTLDSSGAVMLWRSWDRRLPVDLTIRPEHMQTFERIAAVEREPLAATPVSPFAWLISLGRRTLALAAALGDLLAVLGQLALDAVHLLRHPGDMPWREISANLYKSGVRAMPVTALVGFLIGVVLSYLSALQLRQFGADVFIVNILGLGIVRELGPVLTAVLVAGRSGSAMTAQLGVMRVTEEIDALDAMGVPRNLRLVFSKVIALALTMPLLVLWTSAIALVGGMISASAQLGLSQEFFFELLPKVVPLENLWIAQAKGVAFGVTVAVVACHFGLRVRPNTESLSANTTASVVTSITAVILIDAIFAVAMRGIGVPKL
ncbi:MAG: ABC transporter permease [Rhodocyclaceae bacterium]|jgi:phospholipid/cholesterol/gamma-HCH transport system permease protein|nr:ABC transporter permease [Rhodocyclaceae bacterium]